ncbi:MAG: serine hydrolase [Gemmatimonadota bacterium]|nr:MAG: serine hydrolase [Gemmatimonadota bacterium]
MELFKRFFSIFICGSFSIFFYPVVLSLISSNVQAQTSVNQSVDEIIEKHIEALGGYETLKAIQTQRIEQRVSMGPQEIPITIYKKRPQLYRSEQIMPHGDIMVRAVNERNAWIQMGQRNPRQRPDFAADHQRESVADFDGILVDYERKGHSVEIVGMEDIEDTETYELKVRLASGAEQFVYLDSKSYLMKKQIRTAYTPQGEIQVEDVYDDYREVDGIMIPFLIHSQQGSQRFDIKTTAVTFNEPVDDEIFIIPKKHVQFSSTDELDIFLEKQTAEDKFSGVVLIAKDGTPTFHKAYGFASKRFKVPNRKDTKFNIGSINKLFTSVAILQLLEMGKLALDDSIGEYLSDFPEEVADKVTIRHLLQHRSGWGHYWEDETYLATWKDLRTIDDYMEFIENTPLDFEPGTGEQYSNTGYVVLGAIIEKVSRQNYYDYVRDHIFEPIGMKDTDSYEMDDPVENLAIGYTNMSPYGPEEGYQRENIFMHSVKGTSAGGGYSTAEDLLLFDIALRSDRLLRNKYTNMLFNNFNNEAEPGPRSGGVGFAGGAPGINGVIEMNFDTRYTVIVLSNYDPPVAMDLGAEIMDMVRE